MARDWIEWAETLLASLCEEARTALVELVKSTPVDALFTPVYGSVDGVNKFTPEFTAGVNKFTPGVNKCEHCGKPFVKKQDSARFCSTSCRTMAWRRRGTQAVAVTRHADEAVSNGSGVNKFTPGGRGGVLPSQAQPEKKDPGEQGRNGWTDEPTAQGQQALFQKTDERATPKPKRQKKQFPAMPAELASDGRLVEAWQKWVKYRREMGKPVTPTGQAQAFAKFSEIGPAASVAMIEHTMFKGWQGLQPAPIGIRGGGAAPAQRPSLDVTKLQRPEGE